MLESPTPKVFCNRRGEKIVVIAQTFYRIHIYNHEKMREKGEITLQIIGGK